MRPLEEYKTEIVDLLAEDLPMTTESIRLELVNRGFRANPNRRVMISALNSLLKQKVIRNHRDSPEYGKFTLRPGWKEIWQNH